MTTRLPVRIRYPHQDESLGFGFFRLGQVEVHFIAVEVGVVRGAHALVEAERPVRFDSGLRRREESRVRNGRVFKPAEEGGVAAVGSGTCNVGHDAELVQGGLPVEEHDVAVDHVSLHEVADPELLSDLLAVSVLQKPAGRRRRVSL